MVLEHVFHTKTRRTFVVTITIQAIIVIAMIASTFAIVETYLGDIFDIEIYKTLSCYLSLFLLAGMFELVVAFDAMLRKNIIQSLGIILFHAALIVFSTIQLHETKVALLRCSLPQCSHDNKWLWYQVEPFLMVVPCIVTVSWLFLIFCLKKLYVEFEEPLRDDVNGSIPLRRQLLFYQVFICLLKLDFFCFVGVIMQLLIIVIETDTVEFGLTVAAVPVALGFIFGCALAAKCEIEWMMYMALALMVPCMGFFYKLVRFYLPISEAEYITTRATLTVFTIVALLLLVITFFMGIICLRDFHEKLRDAKTRETNQAGPRPRWEMLDLEPIDPSHGLDRAECGVASDDAGKDGSSYDGDSPQHSPFIGSLPTLPVVHGS